jgi:hypothetical protein
VEEDLEPVSVVAIQALLRPQPDEALGVLDDGADPRLRQAVLQGETHERNVRAGLGERGDGREEGEHDEAEAFQGLSQTRLGRSGGGAGVGRHRYEAQASSIEDGEPMRTASSR